MNAVDALIRVEVADEPVRSIASRPKKDGSGMTMPVTFQKAYIHQGNAYPTPFEIKVRAGESPYKPGLYLMGGEVFKTAGDFGNLKFSDFDFVLVPVADALAMLGGSAGKSKLAAAA